MKVSTNLNTHYCILGDNRQIPVTIDQANHLYKLKSDQKIPQNKFVNLPGFVGELRQIREIIEIPPRPIGQGYYCDFGHFHAQHETCACVSAYNCPVNLFSAKLFEIYPKIQYNNQVTETIRNNVLMALGKK